MYALYQKMKQEKWFVALAVVIWLFLFFTTINKTYAYYLRQGLDFETGYIFLRALLIWGVIALYTPFVIRLNRTFPLEQRSYLHAGLHVLFALLFVPLHAVFYRAAVVIIYSDMPLEWNTFWVSIPIIMTWLAIVAPLSYALILAACYSKKYYAQYKDRRLRQTQMEAELASVRLLVLKVQLHPHFLFNTIHNIHALINEAPEKAKRVLKLLKLFLKLSINRVDVQKVRLEEELRFTGIYLEIEKTRFSNRLRINKDIGEETKRALVPSFLLQPLVENAVKHGISKKMQPGIIQITSCKKNERLHLTVEDNGPGLEDVFIPNGVGLENTMERLNQLYDDARFDLADSTLGGLKVIIEIPYERTS